MEILRSLLIIAGSLGMFFIIMVMLTIIILFITLLSKGFSEEE